jgi:predicted nucleic acid-binding protein
MTAGAPTYHLLDTNILVAYVRAGQLGKHVECRFALRSSAYKPLISVVSVGEILSLAKKLRWGEKIVSEMDRLLREFIRIDINDEKLLQAYAELDHLSEAAGRTMGKNDLWIAATARVTAATLLTTDRHFDIFHPAHLTRVWIDETVVHRREE